MDLDKTHKAFVQMAKRLDWTSDHNECCSVPSPHLVPACDLCERLWPNCARGKSHLRGSCRERLLLTNKSLHKSRKLGESEH